MQPPKSVRSPRPRGRRLLKCQLSYVYGDQEWGRLITIVLLVQTINAPPCADFYPVEFPVGFYDMRCGRIAKYLRPVVDAFDKACGGEIENLSFTVPSPVIGIKDF